MGNLVSMHVLTQQPDAMVIRSLMPSSIGFPIYRHGDRNLFAVDTYKASKPPRYPFSTATPATDLPLELGQHLDSISEIYESLKASGSANGIKRSYINISELLSNGLGQSVLSIYSDDDGSDFACLASSGKAVLILACCDNNLVSLSDGNVSIKSHVGGHLLHSNAAHLFELFTGISAQEIGLGSWDAPTDFGFVRVVT
jgi:hypothetical protein